MSLSAGIQDVDDDNLYNFNTTWVKFITLFI